MEIYSKGTLEPELHTYQKDIFKKVVDFSDGNVGDFFGGNIVNFFGTKMEKWQNSYSVYSVSCPCVVKLISSPELHRNSKFCFEIGSSALLRDSTIHLACSALLDWAKPAGQGSFFKAFEIVLLCCRLPRQLLLPVLVLSNPSYSVLSLDNSVIIFECFYQFRGSFAAILESSLRGQFSRPRRAQRLPTKPQQIPHMPKSPRHPRCSDQIHR